MIREDPDPFTYVFLDYIDARDVYISLEKAYMKNAVMFEIRHHSPVERQAQIRANQFGLQL